MATLNFIGRVNIAVRLVREQYPNAELYEAQGYPSKGATSSAGEIDKLRVVFNVDNGTEMNGTAIIESTGWGEFGAPEYVTEPWLEDCVIDWPIEMDLEEACKLIQQAGYTQNFMAVTIRYPLYKRSERAYYTFDLSKYLHLLVDTVTNDVTVRK